MVYKTACVFMLLQDSPPGLYDGVFLMCTSEGSYIARASSDGRLAMLHVIPKPPGATEECLPYAAWQATLVGQPLPGLQTTSQPE